MIQDFKQLFDRYATTITGYAYSAIGDKAAAKDVALVVLKTAFSRQRQEPNIDLDDFVYCETERAIDEYFQQEKPQEPQNNVQIKRELPEIDIYDLDKKKRQADDFLSEYIPKKKNGWISFLIFLTIIMVVLFVWVGISVLMKLQIIPIFDLGYTWFNQTIWNVF